MRGRNRGRRSPQTERAQLKPDVLTTALEQVRTLADLEAFFVRLRKNPRAYRAFKRRWDALQVPAHFTVLMYEAAYGPPDVYEPEDHR